MNRVYQGLSPYNPDWRILFEKEKELLKQLFGDSAREIAHIGSTAVEGLPSKPIIDIAVMIENVDEVDTYTQALQTLGYRFHSNSTERHFFQKGDPVTHHVSIAYAKRGGFWPRQIIFRDYLRSHPDARDEYAALKRELMKKYHENINDYSAGKTAFVQNILSLAGWKEGTTYNHLIQGVEPSDEK